MKTLKILKAQEIPLAKRTCERCVAWGGGVCQNEDSPHANLSTGAGWTCGCWKRRKRKIVDYT